MSSSGAPRKIEGMKSRKVCVIAMAVMKTARAIGGSELRKTREDIDARRRAAMRLIWIPGKRPVKVPARIPMIRARTISINIFVLTL